MIRSVEQLAAYTIPGIPKAQADASQLASIFAGVLLLAGAFCVLFIVLGGVQYIISQGDAAKIKKAKDSIMYAVVGLVVVAVAFFIVQLVIGVF